MCFIHVSMIIKRLDLIIYMIVFSVRNVNGSVRDFQLLLVAIVL